jgi:hypothetical protein
MASSLTPPPPPLVADLSTGLGAATVIANPTAVTAAHSATKTIVAATREREHKTTLVWQQKKAATDGLEHDLAATEWQLTTPPKMPFLLDIKDTFEVSTIASLHA